MAKAKPKRETFPSCTIKKVMIKKIVIGDACDIGYSNVAIHDREAGLFAGWRDGDLAVDLLIKPIMDKGQATFDGQVDLKNIKIDKIVVASMSCIQIKKMKLTPEQCQTLAIFRENDVQCNLRFTQKQGCLL